MWNSQTSLRMLVLSLLAFPLIAGSSSANAEGKESVLARFDAGNNPNPQIGLIADSQGNLYGASLKGGSNGAGMVYELSPGSGGVWAETLIYSFKGGITDGAGPFTQLVFDAHGNLFGATFGGGLNNYGTVFELTPKSAGIWAETVIYSFASQVYAGLGTVLSIDAKGDLYGSMIGGSGQDGTIYALSPQSGGVWKEEVIWTFSGEDGAQPYGGVVLDQHGNVYGTTYLGGAYGGGTVFKLSPVGDKFVEKTLHSFGGPTDGAYPLVTVAIDAEGNLYGTTAWYLYGALYPRVAFGLKFDGVRWEYAVLHTFGRSHVDGDYPSGLTVDTQGNLYGTTMSGGNGCNFPGCGIVFELTTPQGDGPWKETILHQFESADDGSQSTTSALWFQGAVYGTTQYGGGRYGYGIAFQIKP